MVMFRCKASTCLCLGMKVEIIIFRLWLNGWGKERVCCDKGKGKNLRVTSVSAPTMVGSTRTLQYTEDIFRTFK